MSIFFSFYVLTCVSFANLQVHFHLFRRLELPGEIRDAIRLYDERRVLIPGLKQGAWFLGKRVHRQVMGSWITPADPPRSVYQGRDYSEEEKWVARQGWPIHQFLNQDMPYEQFLEDHLGVSLLFILFFFSSCFYLFLLLTCTLFCWLFTD